MTLMNDADDESELTLQARTSSATIRSLFLTAFVYALSDVEHQVDPLLKKHGFSRSQITHPYDRLPLHRFVQLLEDTARDLNRPFLGLEMGKQFGLPDLGPFHALFAMSGSLREALKSFATFQARWQTDTFLETTEDEDTTTYSYRIRSPEIWPRVQDAEFTISGVLTLIRQFYSPRWCPLEVHFEHAVIGRQEHYQRLFRARVLGNQQTNRIIVLNSDLDKALPRPVASDSKVRAILEHHLLDLLRSETATGQTISELTLEIIDRRLGQAPVDCDTVAAELNLSSRSFRRRLADEGTSFRLLMQQTKDTRARTLLAGAGMPLTNAAENLGYADAATFSRAFKAWTGISPGRFKKHPE